jgi:hypothetical protein
MPEKILLYPTVLFDWGDTAIRDYPEITIPMVEYLHSTGRRLVLATSASISDEGQIHGVLARSGLDEYLLLQKHTSAEGSGLLLINELTEPEYILLHSKMIRV